MSELKFCTPKELPAHKRVEAAKTAIDINAANRPHPTVAALMAEHVPMPAERLALITSRWWGAKGVHLTVSFMESVASDLAARIVANMNAWSNWCNAAFTLVPSGGQIRVTLRGEGYWSYIGTDCASIPAGEPTMSLQDFSMSTPESEYHRVVRHEVGHAMGFPHEHQRAEVIALLDRAKTIAYGARVWGWDQATVIAQVLTPLDPGDLQETMSADQQSIMCYQLPGEITLSGQPIPGGLDIDASDGAFANSVYPGTITPPPPPPPPPGGGAVVGGVHVNRLILKGQYPFRGPGGGNGTVTILPPGLHQGDYDIVPRGAHDAGFGVGEAAPAGGLQTDTFDAVIAALMAREMGHPVVEGLLALVKRLGDAYLAGR